MTKNPGEMHNTNNWEKVNVCDVYRRGWNTMVNTLGYICKEVNTEDS